MRRLKIYFFVAITVLITSCKRCKDDVITPTPPNPPPTTNDTGTCLNTRIVQTNAGSISSLSTLLTYNNSGYIENIVKYDSLHQKTISEIHFDYVREDSILIGDSQYVLLDAQKRVKKIVLTSISQYGSKKDIYEFKYSYNSMGFLASKELFINNPQLPNFTSSYQYDNDVLTKCSMLAVSSGNLETLECSITYNKQKQIKNWLYLFPDAIEGNIFHLALNFGKKGIYPPSKIETIIYNPASGELLDTWTTNYSNYVIDQNGYVTSGFADGDYQEGVSMFFGNTVFSYVCK